MKKLFKICLFLFLAIVLAAGSMLLFTQTSLFKNWLRDFIINRSGNFLNATLQIGALDGNLFSHLEVSRILLSSDQDTIIYLPSLSVDILPGRLFSREVYISAIQLDSLYVHLRQFEDGGWNIARVLPGDTVRSADTTASREPLGWTFTLQNLQLSEGKLAVNSPDSESLIPRAVRNIHARLSGHYDDSRQALQLKELRLDIPRPAFLLKQLSFDLTLEENKLQLDSLVLQTSRNRIDAAGVYTPGADTSASTVHLATSPFDISDLHLLVPSLQINGRPEIFFDARERSDSLMFTLNLSKREQNLRLSGMVGGLRARMNDPTHLLTYRVNGMLQHLDIASWTGDSTLSALLNGRFHVSGRGITPREAVLTFEAECEDSRLWDRELTRVRLNTAYQQGSLQGSLEAQTDFGRMILDARLRDIFRTRQFDFRGKLRNVNPGAFLTGDSLQTMLNLDLAGRGSHFTPENLNADLVVNLAPSEIGEVHLDTLFSLLAIRNKILHIDTLHLDSQALQLTAAGTLDMQGSSDLRFDTCLKEVSGLRLLPATDTLSASGKISGRIQGRVDSLAVEIAYQLSGLQYKKALSIDSLRGNLSVFRSPGELDISANAGMDSIIAGGFTMEGAELTSRFSDRRLSLKLDFSEKDSLHFQTEMIVNRDSLIQITIAALELEIEGSRWSGGSDSMQVIINDDRYEFRKIRFSSPLPDSLIQLSGFPEQTITLEGVFSLSGKEKVDLGITGLNLQQVSNILDTRLKLGGLLKLQFNIDGRADNPLLSGSAAVRNGQINRFSYRIFEGNLQYNNEHLKWDLLLQGRKNFRMTAEGILPVNLAFTNRGETLYRDREFQIQVGIDQLALSTMESLSDVLEDPRGDMNLNLNITNTLENPRMDGSLQLSDAAFKIPRYGVDYHDIQIILTADNSVVSLERFKVRSAIGMLSASGETVFEGDIFSGRLKTTRLDVIADKFLAAKNQNIELQIDGKIGLGGDIDTTQLSGDIEILRSRLYLPAFYADIESAAQTAESLPMLVAATTKAPPLTDSPPTALPGDNSEEKTTAADSSATNNPAQQKKSPNIFSDYYHNLNGKIELDIPRNTWLVTEDLKVELTGKLDLIKNGPDLELFGTIRTLRGDYNLLGRRLKIEEGSFTFRGGKEFNPLFHITAVYEFKGDNRQSNILKIEISDELQKPTFSFSLNDQEVNEGDALSYLIFGHGMNELSQGQKSDLAEEGASDRSDFVANYFASKMANQFTRNLGKTLEMDLLELKGQESWKEVSFVVGKYLTNELFISYEKRFGLSQSSNVNKDIITLEWELFRFLILQLVGGDETVSGIDAILRFER